VLPVVFLDLNVARQPRGRSVAFFGKHNDIAAPKFFLRYLVNLVLISNATRLQVEQSRSPALAEHDGILHRRIAWNRLRLIQSVEAIFRELDLQRNRIQVFALKARLHLRRNLPRYILDRRKVVVYGLQTSHFGFLLGAAVQRRTLQRNVLLKTWEVAEVSIGVLLISDYSGRLLAPAVF